MNVKNTVRPCGRERERERERESLNSDSFSLIYYIYRKIPEPDPDRFYRLFSSVAYPFSYPFFASRLLFSQEYTVVIENKNFSEKISLFSDVFLFILRTELLLTMRPTWSAGVFFIYGTVLLPSAPDDLPRIRAPPLTAPNSGQTPEASPGAASAVMRDAHVQAIRQLASRGLSIEEIAPSPRKTKKPSSGNSTASCRTVFLLT